MRRFLTAALATAAFAASVSAGAAGVVQADPGKAGKYDMTSAMKLLCNPNATVSGWDTPQARGLTSIYPYGGKLWTSGGDWYGNKGAAPVFAIDPETGAFARDYVANTETIWYFREGSDGSLYVPGVDQCESASYVDKGGAYFRRKMDGSWEKYLCNSNMTDTILRIPFGNIPQGSYGDAPTYEGMMMHTWDLVNWKGKTFVCGYGIAYGEEGGYECMSNATAALTTPYRIAKSEQGWTSSPYRRFEAFLPFEDDLFCVPSTLRSTNEGDSYPFEVWRFDESSGQFACSTNAWETLAPSFPATENVSPSSGTVILWHPTPFEGRVLYILGLEGTSCRPWILCSAENVNHAPVATRIDLGDGVYPYCITKSDGKIYVVAGKNDAGEVVNSVWESSDGLSFRRIFSFRATQQAAALAKSGKCFYAGLGYKGYCPYTWTMSGADNVGAIYKIPFDHEFTSVSLGPAIAAVKDNGNLARLAVKVDCVDADTASLALSFGGETVKTWNDVQDGETYSFDVATEPGKVYSFSFAATASDGAVATAEGSFSAAAVDGWFEVDFADAGYGAGSGWTDVSIVSNPGGSWADSSGVAEIVDASGASPRHVEIFSEEPVVYTPDSASPSGDDVVIEGRLQAYAGDALPADGDGIAASLFFLVQGGEIRPCGFAGGEWTVFDSPAPAIESGEWMDYAIEIDLNSDLAPRVQYSLRGEPLTKNGEAWLAYAAAPGPVSSVSFRGSGSIGSFKGTTRAKTIAVLPVPAIGGGSGSSGGGIAFGGTPGASGATFSATVSNPVAGAWYTAFTSENVKGPYTAEYVVQAQSGDGTLPLAVDASASAKFMIIVVSSSPFAIGDPLPEE